MFHCDSQQLPSAPSAAVLSKLRNDFLRKVSWTSSIHHMVDFLIGKNPESLQRSRNWSITMHLATVYTLGITSSSATLKCNGGTTLAYILVVWWSHDKLQEMVQFWLFLDTFFRFGHHKIFLKCFRFDKCSGNWQVPKPKKRILFDKHFRALLVMSLFSSL